MFPSKNIPAAIALAALLTTAGGISVRAADADFSGETITALIPFHAGGGTDTLARALTPLIAKYLPGHPNVIFRNMPGGEGAKAFNYLVEKVKPDGRTLAWGAGSPIWPDFLRRSVVRYNPGKFNMVGALPAPSGLVVIHKKDYPRLLDKSKPPLIMGDPTGTSSVGQMLVWGPNFLGWNVKWVVGYRGHSALKLAFARDENNILADYNAHVLEPLKKSGCCVFPAQRGISKDGKMVRSPDWPNVPTFSSLIESKLTTKQARDAYDAWLAMSDVGKFCTLPPKTPAADVKAYRDAWVKATKSKEFDKLVKKLYSPVYTTQTGAEFTKTVDRLVKVSDATLAYIDKLRSNVGIPVGGKLIKKKK